MQHPSVPKYEEAGDLASEITYWRNRGQVCDIYAELDPVHEAAAVIAEVQRTTNQIVVFHNIRGSNMPVASNLYGCRERLKAMVGVGRGQGATLCQAVNWHIERCLAGDRQAVIAASEPDPRCETSLSSLPLLCYHAEDAGRYLTSGILLVRDPETGVHNLSFHRGMFVSDGELRISIGARHDLGHIQRRAEERNQALEATFLVGVPPSLFLAACTSIPMQADELGLAASIAGRPFAVRPGVTVAMDIPDAADIVIEGRILPHELRPEAPFGEWMGNYVSAKLSHVFEVSRTACKPDAVFHGLVCGSNEDLRPLEATTAARIYKALSNQFPGVLDVVCFPGMLCTVVQIRQSYEGQARQVLLAAVTAHFLYSKICIVVDSDVDIYRLDDVVWAYTTRARPDQRTLVLSDLPGFFRDPHKDHWGRLALDATIPWGREDEFRRKTIPGQDLVNLPQLLLASQPLRSGSP